MLFTLSKLNSNLALTLGYLNPALNYLALLSSQHFGYNSYIFLSLLVCSLSPKCCVSLVFLLN